jgi:hypothetical protein
VSEALDPRLYYLFAPSLSLSSSLALARVRSCRCSLCTAHRSGVSSEEAPPFPGPRAVEDTAFWAPVYTHART